MCGQADSERVAPMWEFESLTMGHFFQVSLSNHLTLPGSESMFGLFQGSPVYMCVRASLSQDGFQLGDLQVG